jgi:LysR family cyn operon transcriptional activator
MLLRHLRYLLAVAEHGNFTRAADALHVSQPTLSLQIRQLEESLGVQLLDRSGRAVRPTDMGVVYIEYARRALRDLAAGERAVHDVQTLARGTLRLAMTPTLTTYLTGPLIAGFYARHPGIALRVDEMPLDAMVLALAADQIDLGLAFATVELPDLEYELLFKEELTVVVGASHPFARRSAALTPAQLHGAAMALLNTSFATRTHADAYFQAQSVVPRVAIEANTISALLEIIRREDVATILPCAIAAEHHELRALALAPPLPGRMVAMLNRRDSYRSAAANAFAVLVREWLRAG